MQASRWLVVTAADVMKRFGAPFAHCTHCRATVTGMLLRRACGCDVAAPGQGTNPRCQPLSVDPVDPRSCLLAFVRTRADGRRIFSSVENYVSTSPQHEEPSYGRGNCLLRLAPSASPPRRLATSFASSPPLPPRVLSPPPPRSLAASHSPHRRLIALPPPTSRRLRLSSASASPPRSLAASASLPPPPLLRLFSALTAMCGA